MTTARESYVTFLLRSHNPGRKTKVWAVLPVENLLSTLGEIRWFGRWRCYAFYPSSDTIFERHCMRDIADFCEGETRDHLAAVRAARRSDLVDSSPSLVIP